MNFLKTSMMKPHQNLNLLKNITIPRFLQVKNAHRTNCPQECTYPPQPTSGSYKPYKFIFWIAAMPTIIVMSLYNYREYEHKKKCYQRPPFVKYTYLYQRTHKFPWGDGNHSLFHNKEKNALPEGYED